MRIEKRQVKSAPGDYILTLLPLARAKLYLRETNTDQNDVITDLIYAAVQYLEAGLDFSIDTSSLIYQYYDDFPAEGYLPIWHRYIKTTDLVVEYWNDTAWVALSSANYRVDLSSVPPRVFLKSTGEWPSSYSDDAQAVARIGFKVDTAHSFFYDLKAAAMSLVASRYENLEGDWNSAVMISNVQRFIDRHKMVS